MSIAQFSELWSIISWKPRQPLAKTYAFWKQENKYNKSSKSIEPHKNDPSLIFWRFKKRSFSIEIDPKNPHILAF